MSSQTTAQMASEFGVNSSSMKGPSSCSYSVTEVEPTYEEGRSYPGSNISSNRKKRLMQQR